MQMCFPHSLFGMDLPTISAQFAELGKHYFVFGIYYAEKSPYKQTPSQALAWKRG